MAKKLAQLDPHKIADKLLKIRNEIAAYEDTVKPLKVKEEAIRQDMLTALKEHRMDSFRPTDLPYTFVRAYRKSYEVTHPDTALAWAVGAQCIKIDTTKVSKILTGSGEAIPAGFEYKETEYLQVKATE